MTGRTAEPIVRWRPYRAEYTGSLPNSEVNRRRARSVLGWGTAWEVLWVLPAFAIFARRCFDDVVVPPE